MRPQDVVILVKIASTGAESWVMKDLAWQLGISASEVSESLSRSVFAGLLSSDKKRVMRTALLEFLEHGLKYVFPEQPGTMVRGLATSHSAASALKDVQGLDPVVWEYANGEDRGHSLSPLHPKVPEACAKDPILHELLSLVEVLRTGRPTEKQLAIHELKMRLL